MPSLETPSPFALRTAAHALNRLAYGPRPGEIASVLATGLDRWVREQLSPGPDPGMEAALASLPTTRMSLPDQLNALAADRNFITPVTAELVLGRILRAVVARNQLHETLVEVWTNHFNVDASESFPRLAVGPFEREAIRPHVFGRFSDMLAATAAHPAMLVYLDNYLSTVRRGTTGGINENYGRELLELHTLGVDSGFTQADVIDAARCFTGWGLDTAGAGGGRFVYRHERHDTEAKQVMGLSLPAGGGQEDGQRLLDYLATHPATATRVATKLVQRYVTDPPPASLVQRVAHVFLRTGGDLAATTRAVVDSPEFWAEAFGPGMPKTPFDFTVSALRATGAEITAVTGLQAALSRFGMVPYFAPSPAGRPLSGLSWMNAGALLLRFNFGLDLSANSVPGVRAAPVSYGGDGTVLADQMAADLLGRAAPATRAALASVPASPDGPARMRGVLLSSPEFQVR